MLYQIFVLLLVLAMVGALGVSLFFLLRDRGQGRRMMIGLSVRVGLAVILISFLLLGLATGMLRPSAPWDHVHRADGEPEGR